MLETFVGATETALREIEEEKRIRRTTELFLLFSLGSQFDHLIKQVMEKLGVFCLVADPSRVTAEDVQTLQPKGIVLSGGPASAHTDPPPFDTKIFNLDIPVFGICLGFQLWAQHINVSVTPAEKREFGTHLATISDLDSPLFIGCRAEMQVMESHGDLVESSEKLHILASTENSPVAAARYGRFLYGVQFHPETTETTDGMQIFENFCFRICEARDRYPATDVAHQKIKELRKATGEKKVLLALSGGSDSATTAYLLRAAMVEHPENLRAVYIKGIDRPDDEAHVRKYFANQDWCEVVVVDATEEFLVALRGKITMKDKRIAMRGVYKDVLEKQAAKFEALFIAQGTLYTDIVESGGGLNTGALRARIKMHHNVDLGFHLPELTPLDDCVKDGARNIGRSIGVPEELLSRHPFPGPGLVVRIEGEVDLEKLAMARQVDDIFIEELHGWDLYRTVWQAGAVVTQSVHTVTKGDAGGEGCQVVIWAALSVNGFTARAAELPYDFLKQVDRRITNEVAGVGVVSYQISGKPPATIEWG